MTYECKIHKWPSSPNDPNWRCPGCASGGSAPAVRAPSPNASYHLAGNHEQRLKGRALQERNRKIKERDGYTCKHCGRPGDNLEVDHIVGYAQGGTDDDTNLQCLCPDCHKVKTAADNGFKPKTAFNADGTPKGNHHWNT